MTTFRFQFQSSNRVEGGISTPKKDGTKFSCGGLEPTNSTQSRSVAALWRHRKNMPQQSTTSRELINTHRRSSALPESATVCSGGTKMERRVAPLARTLPGPLRKVTPAKPHRITAT